MYKKTNNGKSVYSNPDKSNIYVSPTNLDYLVAFSRLRTLRDTGGYVGRLRRVSTISYKYNIEKIGDVFADDTVIFWRDGARIYADCTCDECQVDRVLCVHMVAGYDQYLADVKAALDIDVNKKCVDCGGHIATNGSRCNTCAILYETSLDQSYDDLFGVTRRSK